MLKSINIDELQVGMYVQEISEQNGDLKIKSQGRVTSQAVIKKLKQQGIISLLIDLSKQADNPVEETPPEPEVQEETPGVEKFDVELGRAKLLHGKGKVLQKRLLDSIAKGFPIDYAIPQEFTEKLVESIDRNPNALMCLTKIREKDTYLLEHSLNVAILLGNFGKRIGLSELQVQELALSGFLHDIGKINIPDHILHKPAQLTDQEMVVMRDHVYYGVRTLEDMALPEHIIRTVAEHHERLDGYGYPDGARGDEISKAGRMIAIADTYDAITADRCYKAGMPSQKALKILLEESPEKYDRELVTQFIKCVGVYPVGSLVKLNSEQVAMVVEQREDKPLRPKVKVFYSTRGRHYLAPKDLDLAAGSPQIEIEKAVVAGDYGINFNRFFKESIGS